ncbi:uncharacterized protein LOC116256496 [Nymphaea colorata]|nr:uncharacterized protein LOC116256496 [Nymphaea colorata]
MEEQSVAVFGRKLALWHTKTFRPIMTHEELEPIMATLGFVAHAPSTPPSATAAGAASTAGRLEWTEYSFRGKKRQPGTVANFSPAVRPRVRLPSLRLDGLHVFTYRAFCEAVAFHLGAVDIADIFHVRGMPLHPVNDRPLEQFRRVNEEEGQYYYREGTLEQESVWNASAGISASTSFVLASTSNAIVTNTMTGSANNAAAIGCLVALKDIIV